MTKNNIIQEWYLQVFNSKLYNSDTYIDFKIFNINIDDWKILENKLKEEYKFAILNFNKQLLFDDIELVKILEEENRSDYFLEIYLKHITLRIYTNSIYIIEGDIHRNKIINLEHFTELINFMDNICFLLSNKIYFYNEMDEEEPIFTIAK